MVLQMRAVPSFEPDTSMLEVGEIAIAVTAASCVLQSAYSPDLSQRAIEPPLNRGLG